MAATGKTPILLYGSTTATNVPVAGNLTNSSDGCEIAINVADKNLFFKDSTNAVNTVPIRQSSGSSDGWLSSANWTTFNSKQAAYTNLTSIGSLANATGWLYNNGSGTFSYSTPSASDVGAVPTSRTVSTTSPLSGGGALSSNLTLSITQATTSTSGYLSSTDWNTFNNKQPAGTYVTSVTGTAPVVSSGGTTPAISMAAATGSVNGYLTSTDWTTFNSKAPAVTYTTSYIPYGQGTTTPALSNNLKFDGANFAVGGTLSAWNASYPAIEVTGLSLFSSSVLSGVANNAYLNAAGSAYVYKASSYATFYRMYQGEHKFYVAPSGTAGANITWTDAVTIDNSANLKVSAGNVVIGTSGKGIDFSATAGTGTSELLSDYEEGDWTPTLVFASGSAVLDSTITKAKYTKVGRLVTVTGIVYVTSVSTPSGSTYIGGLPYTPASGYGTRSGVSILAQDMQATATTAISGVVLESLANIYIFKFAAGATSNVGADVKADTAFTFCASYMT